MIISDNVHISNCVFQGVGISDRDEGIIRYAQWSMSDRGDSHELAIDRASSPCRLERSSCKFATNAMEFDSLWIIGQYVFSVGATRLPQHICIHSRTANLWLIDPDRSQYNDDTKEFEVYRLFINTSTYNYNISVRQFISDLDDFKRMPSVAIAQQCYDKMKYADGGIDFYPNSFWANFVGMLSEGV